MAPKDVIEARAGQLMDIAGKAPGRKTLGEFKDFLLRGNVVDLAVGVAVGAAFTAVVTAMVAKLFTPLINAVLPSTSTFDKMTWGVPKVFAPRNPDNSYQVSPILIGEFVNAIIAFIIVAAVIFFFVVKPINHLLNARKSEVDVQSTTKECPECLSSIPVAAKRCAFCTVVQPEARVEVTSDAGTDTTTGSVTEGEPTPASRARGLFRKLRGK